MTDTDRRSPLTDPSHPDFTWDAALDIDPPLAKGVTKS